MRRHTALVLLLILCLVAAACTRSGDQAKPAPPPVTQPPETKPPESKPPAADPQEPPEKGSCVPAHTVTAEPSGYLTPSTAVTQGLCGAPVPVDNFVVFFYVPTAVTEEAVRAALRVEGAAQPERLEFFTFPVRNQLSVWFPPGPLGEEITVRLAGPVGLNGAQADLGYRLKRLESPTATVELKVGDGPFQPLIPGSTVPSQPLAIRFRFAGNPDRSAVESQIRQAFEPHKDATSRTIFHLEWESPESLLLSLPAPPPRILIAFHGVQGANGLTMRPFSFVLYTGEAPRLVALDPASGQEDEIGPAPVDVLYRRVSPDGKWVLFSALQGDSAYKEDLYLLDTESGALRKTTLIPSWEGIVLWVDQKLVLPIGRKVQVWDLTSHQLAEYPSAADHLTALSGDGRFLAGFTLDYGREDAETALAPATIVLHDLQTHTEKVFANVASAQVPHKSAPPRMPMVFSSENQALYFQEQVKGPTPEQRVMPRWMKLDLQTGTVSPAGQAPDSERPQPAGLRGPTGWESLTSEWGPVLLRSPQGVEQRFGSGLALGWRPDGRLLLIRWPNFEHRRFPSI